LTHRYFMSTSTRPPWGGPPGPDTGPGWGAYECGALPFLIEARDPARLLYLSNTMLRNAQYNTSIMYILGEVNSGEALGSPSSTAAGPLSGTGIDAKLGGWDDEHPAVGCLHYVYTTRGGSR
jgi:hypothetical protein